MHVHMHTQEYFQRHLAPPDGTDPIDEDIHYSFDVGAAEISDACKCVMDDYNSEGDAGYAALDEFISKFSSALGPQITRFILSHEYGKFGLLYGVCAEDGVLFGFML